MSTEEQDQNSSIDGPFLFFIVALTFSTLFLFFVIEFRKQSSLKLHHHSAIATSFSTRSAVSGAMRTLGGGTRAKATLSSGRNAISRNGNERGQVPAAVAAPLDQATQPNIGATVRTRTMLL
jgi:hypothetical protein